MPENPTNSGTRHPEKDRRIHARQRIHSLSYVKIGDGNGGIVLNVSEGGISVQAASALEDGAPLSLWLEVPRLRERVEVSCEIVWLSASRKEAGLRFVDLPESALQEIRKWMAREAAPEKFEEEADPVYEELPARTATVEREETLAPEPLEADVATEQKSEEFEPASESSEEFARSEDEEDALEARNENPVETRSEIGTEAGMGPEAETAAEPEPAPEVEIARATQEGSAVAEPSETEEKSDAEKEPAAGDKPKTEDEPTTEDKLIDTFGPPVVPFERRPQAPFLPMSAVSGASRGAQNLAIAPPMTHQFAQPFAEQFVQPVSAPTPDSQGIRVQLQTGWFLAALVLLLALISFIAGMAVRRGALNGVLGEPEDLVVPKSTPAPDSSVPAPNLTGGAAASGGATVPSPLFIEVVDATNKHWLIPASTSANHAGSAGATENAEGATSASDASGPNHQTPGEGLPTQAASQPAGGTVGAASGATAGKPNVPLVLSLPEAPISASDSVAISSQRSVPVPPDGNQSAKSAKNLQVGQLINLVEPVYPPEAVRQKIEGTVKLHAVIGTDGVIESLAQVSGPQILVNASMTAVRNWKYSPTRMNGQAIETQEDISFVFRLPN
jgi:TonB family protein